MVAGSGGDSETGAGLPVKSCSAHGGQQGPRSGPRTPHSLPPASPTCHARLLRALGCRGALVAALPGRMVWTCCGSCGSAVSCKKEAARRRRRRPELEGEEGRNLILGSEGLEANTELPLSRPGAGRALLPRGALPAGQRAGRTRHVLWNVCLPRGEPRGCGKFQSNDAVEHCRQHTVPGAPLLSVWDNKSRLQTPRRVPRTDLFLFSNEEEPRIGRLGRWELFLPPCLPPAAKTPAMRNSYASGVIRSSSSSQQQKWNQDMKEEDTPRSQEQEAVPRGKGQGEAQKMSSCRQDERGRVWEVSREWQKYAGSLSLALEKLECWQSPKLDVGKHFENYCSQRASSFQHLGDGGQVISESKTAAAT
ncbi:uncharacterized protein LOC114691054 [Peromyscus leucopus]|uniref:uncharacterized protein LOC114691054 n=1 Tax=Peromyscus leucopus TaxID=10041 RepID=UPI0018858B9A|nr:uncharacterized protein LOC114691054 [Peromyscus leucopus]